MILCLRHIAPTHCHRHADTTSTRHLRSRHGSMSPTWSVSVPTCCTACWRVCCFWKKKSPTRRWYYQSRRNAVRMLRHITAAGSSPHLKTAATVGGRSAWFLDAAGLPSNSTRAVLRAGTTAPSRTRARSEAHIRTGMTIHSLAIMHGNLASYKVHVRVFGGATDGDSGQRKRQHRLMLRQYPTIYYRNFCSLLKWELSWGTKSLLTASAESAGNMLTNYSL